MEKREGVRGRNERGPIGSREGRGQRSLEVMLEHGHVRTVSETRELQLGVGDHGVAVTEGWGTTRNGEWEPQKEVPEGWVEERAQPA